MGAHADLTGILVATVVLSFVMWPYALFLFVMSVAFIVLVFFATRSMRDLTVAEASAANRMTGFLADVMTNIAAVAKAPGTRRAGPPPRWPRSDRRDLDVTVLPEVQRRLCVGHHDDQHRCRGVRRARFAVRRGQHRVHLSRCDLHAHGDQPVVVDQRGHPQLQQGHRRRPRMVEILHLRRRCAITTTRSCRCATA